MEFYTPLEGRSSNLVAKIMWLSIFTSIIKLYSDPFVIDFGVPTFFIFPKNPEPQ